MDERERIYSFRPLPLVKGCRWMTADRERERERGGGEAIKCAEGVKGEKGLGCSFYYFIFNGGHFAFQAESNKKQRPVDGLANA